MPEPADHARGRAPDAEPDAKAGPDAEDVGTASKQDAFVRASIRRLVNTRQKAARMVTKNAQERHITKVQVRRASKAGTNLILMIVIVSVAYMVGNIHALSKQWEYPFKWYAGKPVKGAKGDVVGGRQVYGYLRGPRPKGQIHFSMQCCAISASYPALRGVMGFLGVCPTLPRPAAIFLLTFVNVYFNEVAGVHYSGSAEQLGLANLPEWLSSWEKWQDSTNPFAFMYTSYVAFQNSVARRDAVRSVDEDTGELTLDPTSMLYSLYSGGLCYMCATHFTDKTDVTATWFDLLGSRAVYYRTCQAERTAKAMQEASTAMTVTSACLSVGYMAYALSGQVTIIGATLSSLYGVTSFGAMLSGMAGAAGAALGLTSASAATASAGAVNFWNPVGWFCLLFAVGLTVGMIVGVSVGVAAATGQVSYYKQKCDGGNYFIIVNGRQVKWDGDVSKLPLNQQRPIEGES